MRSDIFRINGMTCAACAKAVERAVKKLDGVSDATVNLATEKLSLTYDEAKLKPSDIAEAVSKAGYEALQEKNTKEVSIPIEGMTCAACAKSIERAVGKLSGVEAVSVNFATEKANVKYDPAELRLSEIKQAIVKAGYKALEIESKDKVDEDKKRKDREIRILWTKFIVSAVFAAPLLYIAMGHMLGLPLPKALHPMDFPLRFALVQILLTVPVVTAGYRFYTVGFKAILHRSPNMDSLIAMGTSAAVLYSLYSTYRISIGHFMYAEDLYFESAGVIITLILLGKSLEAVSKGKTSEAIKKLMAWLPKKRIVIQVTRKERYLMKRLR